MLKRIVVVVLMMLFATGAQAGLSKNGLSKNGLNAVDRDLAYFAACALPEGASYRHLEGRFGLSPNYFAGKQTEREQQFMTACLAAHVNTAGRHVQISVRGSNIPVTATERNTFTFAEGKFFGDENGAFVCAEKDSLDPTVSSPRTCVMNKGRPANCGSNMKFAGRCDDVCHMVGEDARCSAKGREYVAITTYLNPADLIHN